MSWIHDLIGGVAAEERRRLRIWCRRRLMGLGLLVFGGATAVGALVFIAVGGYLSLRDLYSPWESGLIVGGTLLAISLLSALTAGLIMRRRKPAPPPPPPPPPPAGGGQPDVGSVSDLGEKIGESFAKGNVKAADVAIAALVAGTVLGASPALRERLFRRRRAAARSDSPGS